MPEKVRSTYNAAKHHCVCVPPLINIAKVEVLTARGAPVFIGTELARLHANNQVITLRSKISGVLDRVLVNDAEVVFSNQALFEIRNTNIIRGRAGNKMEPRTTDNSKPTLPTEKLNKPSSPRPEFFRQPAAGDRSNQSTSWIRLVSVSTTFFTPPRVGSLPLNDKAQKNSLNRLNTTKDQKPHNSRNQRTRKYPHAH